MTLNQLESFSVLAQRLNFTLAADELFISQPTLSRMISSLEQEIGVALFYRNSRSVALTPAGRAFYQECPRILESYRSSVNAAILAQQGIRGEVSLGILRDTFDSDAAAIYRSMAARYPQIHLRLSALNHSDLIRLFLSGELDAIINYGDTLTAENTQSLLLHRFRQCAVVSSRSPLAQSRSLRMEDLKNEKFVVMSQNSSEPGRNLLWKMAGEAGFTPNVAAESDYVPTLLMLVACGIGVSTLTEELEYLTKGEVSFIPLVGVPLSCHTFTWHENSPNPSLRFLLEIVQSYLKRREE